MALIISKLSFSIIFFYLWSSLQLLSLASAAGYGSNYLNNPNPSYSNPKQEMLQPFITNIAVQGIVYCKSSGNDKLIPLKGALARITCLGVDKYGYETAPFSMLSSPTDKKGYFFFTSFSLYQFNDAVKITECKAFLESSPLRSCGNPTDVNYGQTGALLSSYRLVDYGVKDKKKKNKTKLYSVGPFVYNASPDSNSHSDGY